MSNNATVDFSVNKENKTVTVKREFAASLPISLEEILKMRFKEGYIIAMEGLDELLPSLKK